MIHLKFAFWSIIDRSSFDRSDRSFSRIVWPLVASVIEELSSKDERSKLLREKLAIIQEAQVSAVSADFAAASNLQLLCRDALLKNFGFQPQVFSSVRTAPFEGNHVVGPEPKVLQTVYVPSGKLTWWLARLWLSPRSIESPRPARKWRVPRRRLLELQSLTVWGPRPPRLRALRTQEPPFRAGAGRALHDHFKEARSLARLLRLSLPDNVDGSQVGARLADFAPHWRSLLGICRATGIVEDGVGIAFQQRPQLTHQSISFQTSNSRQDLQQAVNDLLMKGTIERVSNVTRLMWCLPSCSDESGCPQVSAFRGQQGVPVHLSSVWSGNLSTRVHLAAANRVSLFRQQGVKLHVYLDNWLIRADTPEQAQLQAQTTFRMLQFLARSSTSRSPISHQVKTSSSLGCSSTLDVSQWRPTEDASKKVQSVHQYWMTNLNITARDLHRLLGMLVFMGFAGPARTAPSSFGPVVGRHSMVPEDRELVRPDSSSTVGLSEMAWWSSPAVLQGLPLVTKGRK